MILVPLIVVPCAIVGIALVTLLDRGGALARTDAGRSRAPSGLTERVPRRALICMLVLMGVWVLAWLFLLVAGLGILST